MSYMNIPYILDESADTPTCRFKSIWKVQANASYRVELNAFLSPGLFITFEGSGVLKIPKAEHVLGAGTCIIVPSGIPVSYHCAKQNWRFYFISFSSLEMVSYLDLPTGRPMSTARTGEAVRLCERLIDCLIIRRTGDDCRVHLLLQELLLLLTSEEEANADHNRYPELDSLLFQMNHHIGQSITIDELVVKSGLSRTVFFERFRARTGMTPGRYMQLLKLESARVSLETTNNSVKEIAASLHFYDEFHFSKLFKKRYGVSPREYRRRCSK